MKNIILQQTYQNYIKSMKYIKFLNSSQIHGFRQFSQNKISSLKQNNLQKMEENEWRTKKQFKMYMQKLR